MVASVGSVLLPVELNCFLHLLPISEFLTFDLSLLLSFSLLPWWSQVLFYCRPPTDRNKQFHVSWYVWEPSQVKVNPTNSTCTEDLEHKWLVKMARTIKSVINTEFQLVHIQMLHRLLLSIQHIGGHLSNMIPAGEQLVCWDPLSSWMWESASPWRDSKVYGEEQKEGSNTGINPGEGKRAALLLKCNIKTRSISWGWEKL